MRTIAQQVADAGADSVSDAITQAMPDISATTDVTLTNVPAMATQNALGAMRALAQNKDASEHLQWLIQYKEEIEWLRDMTPEQILDADMETLRNMIRASRQ